MFGCIKREEIATAGSGLILGAADRCTLEVTKQESAHAAVGNYRDVSVTLRHGDHALDCPHDPVLCVDGTFPSPYALLGTSEELVCHGLEFWLGQIACCRTVVLGQCLENDRNQSEVVRQYTSCIRRLSLGTAKN